MQCIKKQTLIVEYLNGITKNASKIKITMIVITTGTAKNKKLFKKALVRPTLL